MSLKIIECLQGLYSFPKSIDFRINDMKFQEDNVYILTFPVLSFSSRTLSPSTICTFCFPATES